MEIKTLEAKLSEVAAGSKGIKETMDMLNLLDALCEAYEKSKEDGKIDLSDLQHITGVVLGAVEAFKGASEIVDELKDLDQAEAIAIFTKVFTLVQRMIKALTAKDVAVPVMIIS